MNHQTTYTLLVRSEEKSRDLLETAVYTLVILSSVFAIWQFAQQPNPLPLDETTRSSEHRTAERIAS